MNRLRKRILKSHIEKLKIVVQKFCQEHGLEESFDHFISFGGQIPDNYHLLISNSIDPFVLYSSKSFHEVVRRLDPDFRADAFSPRKDLSIRVVLKQDKEVRDIVASFLKGDMRTDVYTIA